MKRSIKFRKDKKLCLFFTSYILLPEKGGVKEVRNKQDKESERARFSSPQATVINLHPVVL